MTEPASGGPAPAQAIEPPCAAKFVARAGRHPESLNRCFCVPGRCELSQPDWTGSRRLGTCGWVVPQA